MQRATTFKPEDIGAITEQVRRRGLRGFGHRGFLDPDDARAMRAGDNSGSRGADQVGKARCACLARQRVPCRPYSAPGD